jgi:hypothetical protein
LDDQGRVRLDAKYRGRPSVPVLALARVIDKHAQIAPARDIVATALVAVVALRNRARWPLAVLL